MRRDGAQVAAVRRVGQAGHHRHHLGDLLLQLGDLLLPLVDLACKGEKGDRWVRILDPAGGGLSSRSSQSVCLLVFYFCIAAYVYTCNTMCILKEESRII